MDTGSFPLGTQLMCRQHFSCLAILLLFSLSSCQNQGGTSAPRRSAKTIEITAKTGPKMVLIPGGEFRMGSDNGHADESPRHQVLLSPFAMDTFETTQAQFAALALPDPSQFKSPDRPVEQVRWINAAEFCNERSMEEGLEPCYDEVTFECDFKANGYRLPTEAEWEYAARAGADDQEPAGST